MVMDQWMGFEKSLVDCNLEEVSDSDYGLRIGLQGCGLARYLSAPCWAEEDWTPTQPRHDNHHLLVERCPPAKIYKFPSFHKEKDTLLCQKSAYSSSAFFKTFYCFVIDIHTSTTQSHVHATCHLLTLVPPPYLVTSKRRASHS